MNRTTFNSIDELRNSSYSEWLLNSTTPRANTCVLQSTRLEDMIYSDLRGQIKIGLDEIETEALAKLDTFPSLIQDTFLALYSLNLRRIDIETLTSNARHFNVNLLDSIIANKRYSELKSLCEGQELPSYEAVTEFTRIILDRLDELLDNDAMDALNALENQKFELKTNLMEAIESGDPVDEEGIFNMAESITKNEQEIEHLSQIVSRNIRRNERIIESAIISATEKAQEVSDAIKSWGNGDRSPQALERNAEMLRRVQSSQRLRDIINKLGRYRELLDNARKSSFIYGRGEKYDIVLGNDFTCAISSEYALLAMPETVPLFIDKVRRKALKQYHKRERVSKGHGNIVVCIDESGSMSGEPIAWAKAVALVLLQFAAQKKRSCAMARFAWKDSIETHIYRNGKYTCDDILNFAESFLGGGTDFETPLSQAVRLIEDEGLENADIMFITDGNCAISDEFASDFLDKSQQLKFKVTGILIDNDEANIGDSLIPFCEKVYRLSEMTGDEITADIIKNLVI